MQQISILILILFFACNSSEPKTETANSLGNQDASISLVKEVFQIECDHMKNSGKNISGLTTYEFRAEAFQQILKNPDRKLLQHYEVLYQQIADAEYHMTGAEKASYQKEVDAIYAAGCP
jgi:uncharacterized protein YktB (UPF0637 family)